MRLADLTAEDRAALIGDIRGTLITELAGAREGETPEQALTRIQAALAAPANGAAGETDPNFAAALTTAREKMEAQFAAAIEAEAANLERQAGAKLAGLMAGMRRNQHIAQFAAAVTSGSATQPKALPLQAAELESTLKAMPDAIREKVEAMLSTILSAGLIDYAETGKGGQQKTLTPVPDYAAAMLRQVITVGNSVEAFFQTAGLGSASDYDLTPFIK